MRAGDLRSSTLFDGLADDQLAELAHRGTEVRIQPGAELFREGEHADFWWVLVDGAIDLLRLIGRENTVVGRMDVPGRWAGGFRAWDEHGVYLATGRGASAGRVLQVPAEVPRDLLNSWFPFGQHLIEGLSGTARSIEATARQRESLVTHRPAARRGRSRSRLVRASSNHAGGIGSGVGPGVGGEHVLRGRTLIDNAIDAMDGSGTLGLATRAGGGNLIIEVRDTGPGMPPQVAARAFEAFYTTKDAGQGAGLGLDIARRIVVERHGGAITIDSRPGQTVLRVRMPARPPALRGRSV